MTVRLQPDEHGPALVRNYSLSGQPGDGEYRISVKAEPFGAASTRLQRQLHPGDSLDVAAPRGSFILADDERPVVLSPPASAPPPCSPCCTHSPTREPGASVWWLHGARDRAEHAFAAESRALLDRMPHRAGTDLLQPTGAADRPGSTTADNGRIDADLLDRAGLPATPTPTFAGLRRS